MKRMIKILTATALAVSALVVSSSAASFDHCADALKTLGLFQGTAQGYELDRAPTRGEAATMLVRLLGKEAEAKALTYSAPFTDLDDWQKPYVQYLYENKLTNGASETTFEPEDKCSAQMYSAFLMRALGYSETSGDFTYDKVIDKAKEIGLADMANCNETNFLRDNVAAMSYTALAVAPKDKTADTLLEKLVAGGAVDKTAAASTQKAFQDYKDYLAVSETLSKETKMDMSADVSANVKMNGANAMTMTMPMSIKMDMNMADMDKSVMAMATTAKVVMDKALIGEGQPNEMEMKLEYFYTNGVYYMSMDGEKIKMPMSFKEIQNQIGTLTTSSSEPLSLIKSISKSGNVYTVSYEMSAMNGMIQNVLQSMGMDSAALGVDLQLGDVTAKMTVENGKITTMDMSMAMKMSAEGQSMDMDMTLKCKVNATGDSVKITLPTDLDTYKDMEELLASSEATPAA